MRKSKGLRKDCVWPVQGAGKPVTLGRWVWTPLAVMGGSGLKGREELGHSAEAPMIPPSPWVPRLYNQLLPGQSLGCPRAPQTRFM